jgi:hypothetical protein
MASGRWINPPGERIDLHNVADAFAFTVRTEGAEKEDGDKSWTQTTN